MFPACDPSQSHWSLSQNALGTKAGNILERSVHHRADTETQLIVHSIYKYLQQVTRRTEQGDCGNVMKFLAREFQ